MGRIWTLSGERGWTGPVEDLARAFSPNPFIWSFDIVIDRSRNPPTLRGLAEDSEDFSIRIFAYSTGEGLRISPTTRCPSPDFLGEASERYYLARHNRGGAVESRAHVFLVRNR